MFIRIEDLLDKLNRNSIFKITKNSEDKNVYEIIEELPKYTLDNSRSSLNISNTIISRAIEAAKHRLYKLKKDLDSDASEIYRNKAENQTQLAKVTIFALEKALAKDVVIQETDEKAHFKCPNCSKVILTKYKTWQSYGEECEYCDKCGQHVSFKGLR